MSSLPTGTTPSDPPESSASSELDDPELPYAGFTWTEAGIIVGVCLLLAAILTVTLLTEPPCCGASTQRDLVVGAVGRLFYYFLWALGTIPIFWACVELHPRKVNWSTVVGGHLALAFVLAYVVSLGRNALASGLTVLWPPPDSSGALPWTPPLEVLVNLEFLNQLVPYLVLLVFGFVREGYLRGRARQKQAERLERETEQLRSKLTAARLESLRMQLNPHFFHNTLHTISTMAGRDPEGIRRATARLSDLMRHVLSTSDQQETPLDEELRVLESYLDIQQLRLDDRLEVTFDVDPAVRSALVPTLLLQPLAENAVKHGFEGTDESGHLSIRAMRDEDTLVLVVADDGAGLPENGTLPENGDLPEATADGNGIGLQNIAERLDSLYGEDASIDFTASKEGVEVVLRLPFHEGASGDLRTSGVVAS